MNLVFIMLLSFAFILMGIDALVTECEYADLLDQIESESENV